MLGCFRGTAICVCLFALTLGPATSVFAQSEEEMDILQMIYKDKDLVTPTRSSKPISQVAENVTVIDAEEIEAINAHTLALTEKKGGKITITGRVVYSADGKTRTLTATAGRES